MDPIMMMLAGPTMAAMGTETITGSDGRMYVWDQNTGQFNMLNATDPAVQNQLDLQDKRLEDFINEQKAMATVADFDAQQSMQDIATATGFDATGTANQIVGDPSAFFNEDMRLSSQVPTIDAAAPGTTIDPNDPRFAMSPGALNQPTSTGTAAFADAVAQKPTATYDAATTFQDVSRPENQMVAAQGQVRDEAIITAPQADMQGLATGVNADGTISYAGQALGQFANQNITNVIDTSTMSGKLLADSLGQFNYTDAKTTVQGQMDLLSKDFVDPVTGETKIPTWAAGTARSVSRIAAFKGMTGSAATATMAQAIMEASLPIAQADAQFFQTLTIKNLDNKQQQIINTANVLSKMELANLDARMATAVENSKNFMQMDLANLDNQQQAKVINTQSRIQSILEDAKAVNTARLFAAESINEQNKFYDNLNSSISTFNASQKNAMTQFNVGQINSMSQFNAQLETQREQFYKEMQYNIDIANSKWRQSVTLQNAAMEFDAAATDVKNMVGLSVEQLNQLWDRSDALLDYAWRSSETQAERENQIKITKLQAEANMSMTDKSAAAQRSAANSGATGSIIGAVVGGAAIAF
jgi:hypothetical protein